MLRNTGFGLYVHWPFCQAKCPYCDFNSHVAASVDQARWETAFLSEIRRNREATGARVLNSIYFGGGTPSLMAADTVAAIINAACSAWAPSNDMEITLEANPSSVEADRFADYAQAGVNRVSIGVQSLRDHSLRALGRLHSVDQAKRAIKIAQATFARTSFDLIYARQHQSLQDWRIELGEALDLAQDHLSLYQLTIEPDTAFGARHARGGLAGLPDNDLGADMYSVTQEMTSKYGFDAYEISNHAKAGGESRHNLIYWQSGDWVGIGPGAHGRITEDGRRVSTETYLQPDQWLISVETSGTGETKRTVLTQEEIYNELIMMGLRLSGGIPVKDFEDINKINELVGYGVLELHEDRVRATHSGRPILNAILRHLLV